MRVRASWQSRPWSERVAQARRDLAMLGAGWRGERRGLPVLFAKRSSGRTARVVEVVRETDDAVTLVLDVDGGLVWRAGEFLTIGVRLSDRVERRAYSLCVPPNAARPAITVKRIAAGRVSRWLVEHAAPGLLLEVAGPSGRFVFTPDASRARTIVLVGGGSGITPLRAIAETALAHEPESRVVLIYGNRAPADVIFAERIAELVHDPRFTLVSVFGLLDQATLAPLLADASGDEHWLCGPEPMMAAAREVLASLDAPPSTIHEERFLALGGARDDGLLPSAPQRLRIRRRGAWSETQVAVGQTLLEAGLAAAVPMPSSCTLGGCGACRVRLLAGEVQHQSPNCLGADERADGWVLACVARPLTPVELEVDA